MKELVTIIIPIFDGLLSSTEKYALSKYQEYLSDFPITFVKGINNQNLSDYIFFCPEADVLSFDDRYFHSTEAFSKFLLNIDLYEQFSWSRYLLIGDLNTEIKRNELAYWCRQGYDLIQHDFLNLVNATRNDNIMKIIDPQSYIQKFATKSLEKDLSCVFSLRKVETMQNVIKRNKKTIHQFFKRNPGIGSDAVFWKYYINRLGPVIITPNSVIRAHFIESRSTMKQSSNPFAVSGIEDH